MSQDSDRTTPSPFQVIDGGKSSFIEEEDLPFELPTSVMEFEGLRIIQRPGFPPLYERDDEVLSRLSDKELNSRQIYVLLELHDHPESMEPGDAARLLLERLEQHGRLTRARRRILENMPEHGHQMTQNQASNFYTMMGWLERWWPGLREY